MNILAASFRGIQFHVEEAAESVDWHYQTSEYITNHPPSTVRYSRAPNEFLICGVLLGHGALLTRDLLTVACDNPKPGKLIHPLYGIKDVICVSRCMQTFGTSINAFRFTLQFREAEDRDKKSYISSLINKAAEIRANLDALAMKFVAAMAVILESAYLVDQAAQMLVLIDGFMRSNNGLGVIPAAIGSSVDKGEGLIESAKSLIRSPRDLFHNVLRSVDSKTKITPESLLYTSLSEHKEISFLRDTLTVILLERAERGANGKLPHTFALPISLFLESVGNNPLFDDDTLFAYVWEKSLEIEPLHTQALVHGDRPSLVAAYEDTRSLDSAEEMAHAARQPFKV